MTAELPHDPALHRAAAAWRAQRRLDEDEWTRASLEQFEHARSLLDVLRSRMHRGDAVTLGWAGGSTTGVLVALGADYVVVAPDRDGVVAVPVTAPAPAWVRVAGEARVGGTRGTTTPATFRGWLLSVEGAPVLAAVVGGAVVQGTLGVSGDHVRLDDDGVEWRVPLSGLWWVRARPRA